MLHAPYVFAVIAEACVKRTKNYNYERRNPCPRKSIAARLLQDRLLRPPELRSQGRLMGRTVRNRPARRAVAGMPRGKIGKLEVSRLILGGNLLTHFTHSRDLRYVYSLTARYNTDEKILETLAQAEAHGINTLTIHNPPHPMEVLRRYRKERGGKIQWIICPTATVEPGLARIASRSKS